LQDIARRIEVNNSEFTLVGSLAGAALRQLRRGRPIIVVSGLPRSGTSMMMRMLEAGGLPVLTDGLRTADESNPRGYYEFEPVKELDRQGARSWLPAARGKAVKIISFLLTWLPDTYDYRVILIRRDLDETIASQNQMLVRRGETVDRGSDQRMRALYAEHLAQVGRFLAQRKCFSTLVVEHREVLREPQREAARLSAFLGAKLDASRMAAVVDPALHRNQAVRLPQAQVSESGARP